MNTINNQIKRYEYKILQLFEPLRRENIDLTNSNLASIFEYYSCIMLMQERNKKYYVYDDVSINFKNSRKLSKQDTGIDYISQDGNAYGQAKLRKSSLRWNELGTFMGQLLYCLSNGKNIEGILSYNEGISFSNELNSKRNIFTERPYNKDDMIQYFDELLENKEEIYSYFNRTNEYEEREYQIEAISLIKDNPNKNIIIHLPTGSGKTFIMSKSIEPDKKYLILVPRIILLKQTKDIILSIYPEYINKINTIGDRNISYSFNPNHLITICVYNSIDFVLNNIDIYDRIYIDEAHHIMKPLLYEDFNIEDNESDTISEGSGADNQTYIEKIYTLRETEKCVYFSATIERVDDMLYYGKSIRWMIENKYLCDYTIQLPVFNQTNEREICKYLVNNYRHYIIYCNSREDGIRVTNYLNEILPNSAEFIDCNTSKNERNIMIQKYNNGQLSYLVNIRVLTEGFNAPITEGVCMLHIPRSKIMISQVLGRALRKYAGKIYATIMFPITEEEECRSVARVLKILTDNDEKYQCMFANKSYYGMIEPKIISNSENDEIDNDCDIEMNSIAKHLYDIVFDSLGEVILGIDALIYKVNKVKEFIDENNRRPNSYSKNENEKRIAKWISHRITDYNTNKGLMKNSDARKIWEEELIHNEKYREYFMNKDDKWQKILDEVRTDIIETGERPSRTGKYGYRGRWLDTQLTEYKKKNPAKAVNRPVNTQLWEGFINDERIRMVLITIDDKFMINIKKCDKFFIEKGRRPNSHSKNEEERGLATFLVNTSLSYKNNKNSMKDPEKKRIWENFVRKHKRHFVTDNDKWIQNCLEYVEFILINRKLPSKRSDNNEEKRLGTWAINTMRSYRYKIHLMKQPEIVKFWEEKVLNRFPQKFKSNSEIWFENSTGCTRYFDTYNRKPRQNKGNEEERKYGRWLSTQISNYKRKKGEMKKSNIRRFWEENYIYNEKYSKFVTTKKDKWLIKFNKYKQFIIDNRRRPSSSSKNKEEKELGIWGNLQLGKYRLNEINATINSPEIRSKWEEFISDKKYRQHFMSYEQIWEYKFEKVKVFLTREKRRPNARSQDENEATLGNWLQTNITNYRKQCDRMKDESYRQKWQEFITSEEYSKFFN
jgi:superfamily II DNA or RNA helicase